MLTIIIYLLYVSEHNMLNADNKNIFTAFKGNVSKMCGFIMWFYVNQQMDQLW